MILIQSSAGSLGRWVLSNSESQASAAGGCGCTCSTWAGISLGSRGFPALDLGDERFEKVKTRLRVLDVREIDNGKMDDMGCWIILKGQRS